MAIPRRGRRADVVLSIVAVDFSQELKDLRATMDSVRGVIDLARLEAQIQRLEEEAAQPNLWDDQEPSRMT